MGFLLVISFVVLWISKISSKPIICGPNTAEIIFTKHGIICATTSQVPHMKHLSLDSTLVPRLIASPLMIQQIRNNNNHNYGREQIDRRPDLIEDKIAKYQRMLLEKLKRDSLAKRLVRHRVNTRLQNQYLIDSNHNSNLQIQNPVIQSQIELQNPQQTYVNNQNLENSYKDEINSSQEVRENDYSSTEQDSEIKPNHLKDKQNIDYSSNNRQGVKHKVISGTSASVEANNKIAKNVDEYDQQPSNIEPQVSQTQVYYRFSVGENVANAFPEQNNFGFPRNQIKNTQSTDDSPIILGSPKIPKLNFGFRPLLSEHKEVHLLRQTPRKVDQKKFIQIPNYLKPVLSDIKTDHRHEAFTILSSEPQKSDQLYKHSEEKVIVSPHNHENIHNFEAEKWDQRPNTDLKLLRHQNSDSDLVQSSSHNNYMISDPNKYENEFYLDKSRIEYQGWKPIRMYGNSKSISDQQLIDDDFQTTYPSTIKNAPQI